MITLPKKELDGMLRSMAKQTETLLIINEWIKDVNTRLDRLENTSPDSAYWSDMKQYG